MKVLAYITLFASLLTNGGCVSFYATEKNPVVINAPNDLNDVQLAKRVLYSLAARGWTIENFDLHMVDAVYRRIPIHVEMAAGQPVTVNHRKGGIVSRNTGRYLKRWVPKFQQTLSQTYFSSEDDIDLKLKSRGISPSRVEKLTPAVKTPVESGKVQGTAGQL